jgi:hypothetical protein
LAAYA